MSIETSPSRTVEDRVQHLVDQMTLDEKAAQLTSVWLDVDADSGEVAPFQVTLVGDAAFDPADVMSNGIGHITRPLGTKPVEPEAGIRIVNGLQRRLVEDTRLGIPAICHEECLTGLMAQGATSFPSPLNFASAWDPGLVRQVGDVIRRQMRRMGVHQGLAPVADVARDARWGRVEETLGEDPYLVGTLVTEYVRGLQGDDLTHGVVATLKHFAGYSFSEAGRNFGPAHVGRRELEDVFLVPFEMAVRAGGALGVMNAYQTVDGEPCGASGWMLTEVLRERWKFAGAVVADYGAVTFLETQHRVAADSVEATAMALRAGLDVELPYPAAYPTGIPAALERGLLDMATVDEAVRRVLRLKVRLGLFEHPYVAEGPVNLRTPGDAALARTIAERSIVLLANDGTLPLDPTAGRVLVVGPNAAEAMALFGNYSFENHIVTTHFPDRADEIITAPSVLDVLRQRLGAHMAYERGCDVMGDDRSGIDAAARAAAGSDVVIAVVGDKAGHFGQGTVGEGTDTDDLSLPGVQAELVDALLATGTPTIVVLLNGRPFALPDIAERAAAIIEAWFPGEEGAAAIADVVFGDRNPAGRTVLTFSRSAGAQPRFYNHTRMARGVVQRADFPPVFPFGHGLSYTEFAYDDLRIEPAEVPVDGTVSITCSIRNTGDRDGDEVVQVYAVDRVASVARPIQQLVAFTRVPVPRGATVRTAFDVPIDLLSFTGIDHCRVVEPGEVDLLVGASAADIRLRGRVTLTGEVRQVGADRRLFSRAQTG